MKLLRDLYYIYSPSGVEYRMSEYVQNYLKNLGIDFWTLGDQIYNIKPNTPMVCAHMDHVGTAPLQSLYIENEFITGDENIGADDKNGIWICLKLIEEFPEISFIFSTGEESGCDIDKILSLEEGKLKDIMYCLVFDRRNGTDIVGVDNNYCSEDLENTVYNLGRDLGYKPAMGIFSDCDMLSLYGIPCVNLSCGYYKSHTKDEFTDLDELLNAKILGGKILNRIRAKFERAENYEASNYYHLGWDGEVQQHTRKENEFDAMKTDSLYCYNCHTYFKEKDLVYEAFCPGCGEEDTVADVYDSDVDPYTCPICKHELEDPDDVCAYCGSCLVDDNENFGPHHVIDTMEDFYCPNCERIIEEEEAVKEHCPDCNALLMFCETQEGENGEKTPIQYYLERGVAR